MIASYLSGTKVLVVEWGFEIINSFIQQHTLLLLLRCCVCECSVVQLCPTLCSPMDCSPPDSSVHRLFQARILEQITVSSSRGQGSNLCLLHLQHWQADTNIQFSHGSYPYKTSNLRRKTNTEQIVLAVWKCDTEEIKEHTCVLIRTLMY